MNVLAQSIAALCCFVLWLRWAHPAPVHSRPFPQPYYHRSAALLWGIGRLHLGVRLQFVALVR